VGGVGGAHTEGSSSSGAAATVQGHVRRVPASMIAVEKIDNETVELKRVSTVASFRRYGLSKLLLTRAEAFARGHGYKRIVLGTSSAQLPAINMYEKAGYKLIESKYRWFAGFAELTFEKKLD
jgi:putative acetyltransferase